MKEDEIKISLWRKNVPVDILRRIEQPHSKERPGIPFAWMVSYEASCALQNIRFFENGSHHCQLDFPIRVFFSKWTDAIVVTFVPIEAIKEIHVMEWYLTFYEVPLEEAKERLTQFPRFPYDGRNPDIVRAEIICNGGYQKFIDDARKKYREMDIELPSHVNFMKLYDQDK